MRYIGVLVATLTASSCAVVSHDVTNDEVAASISGKCFVLKQAAYIINIGGIGPRDQLLIPTGRCRAPDGTIAVDRSCRFEVKSHIPVGSTLVVTSVTDKAYGESGRCWDVRARFEDTQLYSGIFKIPTCIFESYSGGWLQQGPPELIYGTGTKLTFRPEKLETCGSRAP
jgi:hypothetical protein